MSAIAETDPGQGNAVDTWTGQLRHDGSNYRRSASKTVRTTKGAKRMRVRYAAKAQDAVHGGVPVVCAPRSGSFFQLGRTKVTCSAVDSSGNSAHAAFTITVKR